MLIFNSDQERVEYFSYTDEKFDELCVVTPLLKQWYIEASGSKLLQHACKESPTEWDTVVKKFLFRASKVIAHKVLKEIVDVDFTMAMYAFWVYMTSMDNVVDIDVIQFEFNFFLCVTLTLSNGYLDKTIVDQVVAEYPIPTNVKEHLNQLRQRGTVAVVDLRPFRIGDVIYH